MNIYLEGRKCFYGVLSGLYGHVAYSFVRGVWVYGCFGMDISKKRDRRHAVRIFEVDLRNGIHN